MKNLFDSHCHLNEDGINVKETIENAKERGIDAFLVVGWDIKSSKKAVELANEFDEVYAAVGIHPENYETENEESLRELETLAKSKKVVAIGEIGLDYHWKNDEQTKKEQKEWFIKQIKLANKLNLPVSIHARDAINDVYQTIKENPINKGFVLHCYSGSYEMMERFKDLGAYFGFDGPITYKNSITPKECVKKCDIDKLLIETDSPYLPPVPYRGKRNQPAYIKEIFDEMVILRNENAEELSERLNDNFRKLFGIER